MTHKVMALRKLVQRSLNLSTLSQVSGPFVRTLTHYPVDDTVSGLNDDQRYVKKILHSYPLI